MDKFAIFVWIAYNDMRLRLILTILLMPSLVSAAQDRLPYGFRRLQGTDGIFSAYAMVQDSSRYLWIGSDAGLVKYDGYRCEYYRYSAGDSTSLCQDHVNTLLYCPGYGKMVAGTDAGASVYDFSSDSFFQLKSLGYRHVKSLLADEDVLWVGTVDGLLRADVSAGLYPGLPMEETGGLPSSHIACVRKIGRDIYFGAYDHVYRMTPQGSMKIIGLPTEGKLVLDITADPDNADALWIGSEQGLIHYDMTDGSCRIRLENIPVKYFFRNDESLWIGTDNGLYIMGSDGHLTHFYHSSESSRSLPNNVVWCIFKDCSGNMLLGMDHTAAIAGMDDDSRFTGIWEMTGRKDGLEISVMAVSSDGGLWVGGMNGLVRMGGNGDFLHWYKSDSGPYRMRLAHNKVRDVSDDGTGMWVVSDGGLDRISYADGSVRHFSFIRQDGGRFSNWMYSVRMDVSGRLWLGSYDGLLLIDDVPGLMASEAPYTVDMCLSGITEPSLSGTQIMDIAILGDKVFALSNGHVDIVDASDSDVRYVTGLEGRAVSCIEEGDGCIWAGTYEGVCRITEDGKVTWLQGFPLPVSSLTVSGNRIFVMSGNTVSVYDMVSGQWDHSPLGEDPIFCSMEDRVGNVLMGTVDGYFTMPSDRNVSDAASPAVSVTGLVLDNSPVRVGEEYDGNVILPENISMTDKVTFGPGQNSFAVEFSTFDFSEPDPHFFYRLTGLDDRFQMASGNRAVFINVPAGEYVFEVYSASSGMTDAGTARLGIRVRPFWYATTAAFIIYFLLVSGAVFWVIYFMRMRHQLQIEHIEREDALNMAKMKTDFFANISHEFKSPLSIILGLVGRMVSTESDSIKSRELGAVRKNAEKMHILLNQMLEFNENGGVDMFIPSASSLQQLAKEVFDAFVPSFEEKNINFRFVSDEIGYVFMLDRVKMESVFRNLLSNALKFTPSGGTVLMSVTIGEETQDLLYADVKVEDTGCGIMEDELPFLFTEYYKAPSNQKENVNGSGIGLYLTKKIVEMHKGRISVVSSPGMGTCFTIRLSTMKADSFVLKSGPGEDYTLHNLSKVWQHERKPIVLLVEDNPDIRDFIEASLGKDYKFCVASDGRQGLEILEKEKIDLVITDITMPGMDGLEMSRTIRNNVRTAFLPIIVLTGKNDMQTRLHSFEYADAFIAKPFDLNYLNSLIIRLLIKHEQYLETIRKQKMLEPEVDNVVSPDEKFLQEITDIVNRHIADPEFSASVLCNESHYGSKQVYRKIKQLTGMGVVEFIRDTRLQKAAMYLSQKKLTVTEIMYMVGFTTPSWFAKCFKSKYGVSPSEYQ